MLPAMGFSSMFGAGMNVLGGVSDYMESKRVAKSIQASKELEKLRLEREGREKVAEVGVSAAGRGVEMSGSTLDAENKILLQNAMDKAITMENYRMQKRDVQAQGKAALIGGLMGAGGQLFKGAETAKFKQQILSQNKQLLGEQKKPLATPADFNQAYFMGFGK